MFRKDEGVFPLAMAWSGAGCDLALICYGLFTFILDFAKFANLVWTTKIQLQNF